MHFLKTLKLSFYVSWGLILLGMSQAQAAGCFYRHIQEAIDLNLARKPIYSQISGGYSTLVSDRMIQMEEGMKIPAWILDRWAKSYQKRGIPVLCQDLEEMSLTPKLPKVLPLDSAPLEKDFVKFNPVRLQSELKRSFKQGMKPFIRTVQSKIDILHHEPRLNCLVRHFLESIRSFAQNSSTYLAQLPESERASFKRFINLIIKSHIGYLAESHEIDELSLPLHIVGVPIVCQDVPPIPSRE